MSLVTDPRWVEYNHAYNEVSMGLSAPAGAQERYRHAQLPYVELLAEQCAPHVRKHMMAALFSSGMALGIIAMGFKADEAELEYVKEHPPTVAEPVDEIERLQRMPYGQYLRTEHWQKVRQAALERAEHRCTICNRGDGLEVHHRDYSRRGHERPADVAALCGSCHSRYHGTLRAA